MTICMYTSDGARHSCTSDDLNNTSSTLRQEAISITKVRCKRRKTWIRSPSSPIQISSHSPLRYPTVMNKMRVDGRDAHHNTSVNSTMTNKIDIVHIPNASPVKETIFLHNDSFNDDQEKIFQHTTLKTLDYQQSMSSIEDKDTQSVDSKRSNDCYSSLSPVKRLLNESIDSNIEIIQMDEQECVLEIVDGVLTIVPKDKSISSSTSANSFSKPIDSKYHSNQHQHAPRSSSIASSISSPSSLSEHEREDLSSISSSHLSSKRPTMAPVRNDSSTDVLDLFSSPLLPINSKKHQLTNGHQEIRGTTTSLSTMPRASSPIQLRKEKSFAPSKEKSPVSVEHQTRSNKSNVLSELLKTVKKSPVVSEKSASNDISLPKSEPPPTAKPINKARINEFAALLSSSVHLTPSNNNSVVQRTTPTGPKNVSTSAARSSPPTQRSFEDRESIQFDQETSKKHIDARYNEKIDDRSSIQVNTANIKAIFEQKISTASRSLSQSSDHISYLPEAKQQKSGTKRIPVSYPAANRNSLATVSNSNRSKFSSESFTSMNRLSDHSIAVKPVVIEDKQLDQRNERHVRQESVEPIIRPRMNSSSISPVIISSGSQGESLIAREIRETKEKEEELRRQRKKCGLNDSLEASTDPEPIKVTPVVKSSSFLSNLDFFASKANNSSNDSSSTNSSPRRSIVFSQNVIYDSQVSSSTSSQQSSHEEFRQITKIVSQELHRFNESGIPIVRTNSTHGHLQRSSSNHNILIATKTTNIIQQEIEAIRAKESELRQLGRIQHTSDEHSDPRKYKEFITTLTKSQSTLTLTNGKIRRDSENQSFARQPMPAMPMKHGFVKPKSSINHNVNPLGRGKFPQSNPSVPIISAVSGTTDSVKLSLIDRLELEKRQCQEREEELRKQRHTICVVSSSTSSTVNSDSGNVSQEEHDEDQERYFDKIQRLKRTEHEKAQAPLVRPTKKFDMSQKWEQMIANRIDD